MDFAFSRLGNGSSSYRETLNALALGVFSLYNTKDMKYSEAIANKMPLASFMLDETAEPVLDYSGNGHVVKQIDGNNDDVPFSQPNYIYPAVNMCGRGWTIDTDKRTQFRVPNILTPGSEKKDFSIELWLGPWGNIGYSMLFGLVFSHGVFISGTGVGFSLDFVGSGSRWCSAERNGVERTHVVATKNSNGLKLYLNGTLASSVDFNEAQRSSEYSPYPTVPYPFAASTSQLSMNALSLYERELTPAEIESNYKVGSRGVTPTISATVNGGRTATLGLNSESISQAIVISSESDWASGVLENLSMENGSISPTEVSSLWVTNKPRWSKSFRIEPVPDDFEGFFYSSPNKNVRLLWSRVEAGPYTMVETNSIFWKPNNTELEQNNNLYIRLEWRPGSNADENSSTTWAGVFGVRKRTLSDAGAFTVSGSLTYVFDPSDPTKLRTSSGVKYDSMGFEIETYEFLHQAPSAELTPNTIQSFLVPPPVSVPGDSAVPTYVDLPAPPSPPVNTDGPVVETPPPPVTLPTPTTEKTPVRTIEIWGTREAAPVVKVSGTTVTPTFYYNGKEAATPWGVNPSLIHIVLPASTTEKVSITGIAPHVVTLFDRALTLTDIQKIFAAYNNHNAMRVDELSTIQITQPSDSVENYSFDWTTSAAT